MSERNISTPANSREAAIKILMGDIAPLFQKAEEISNTLVEVQGAQQLVSAEFSADAEKMGEHVQTIANHANRIEAGVNYIEAVTRRLEAQAARMASPPAQPTADAKQSKKPSGGSSKGAVGFLVVLLVLALAAAGFLFYERIQNRNTLAAGQAVLKAWTELPKSSQAIIERAGSR